MPPDTRPVKVQNTQDIDRLAGALLDLFGLINSPQRDDALLREAGVDLDRALFPLLVRLGRAGPMGVAELADQAGRDHTTVSRQLAKLESLGLVRRAGSLEDRRRRAAELSEAGAAVVAAISGARRRLLTRALADWRAADRAAPATLAERFVAALRGPGPGG